MGEGVFFCIYLRYAQVRHSSFCQGGSDVGGSDYSKKKLGSIKKK